MGAAPRSRRVLLIHGAWHGAWCWERVLAPLRTLGYEPEAIDLPGHGEMRLQGDGVTGALYGDCDLPTRHWAVRRLDPQSTSSFIQASRRVAWKSRPSTYVVCTEDRTIPPWLQRTMARRADRVIDLPASHSPFLSMPERLARVLADTALDAVRSGRGETKEGRAREVLE